MKLDQLIKNIKNSKVTAESKQSFCWSEEQDSSSEIHYENKNHELGIHFQVEKIPFGSLQVIDPRIVKIAPRCSNEKHRHAHESLFVVISGEGKMEIGQNVTTLSRGDIAYVPRWVVHQTINRSDHEQLVMLAITDFGLTSAALGDYDAKTRLKCGGTQAFDTTNP